MGRTKKTGAATKTDTTGTEGMATGVAMFGRPDGNLPCLQTGCAREDGVHCHYVDAHDHRCPSTWCSDHWNAVGGIPYCRRHANTIVALGDAAADPLALPDLDNRGPSLVNWVFRDLDTTVRQILDDGTRDNETADRDTAVTVVVERDRTRSWKRSWRILDAEGNTKREVSIAVGEHDDALVHLSVDDMLVASGIPPWIDRHRRGVEVTQGVDLTQREIFYSFLHEHIHARMLSRRIVQAS